MYKDYEKPILPSPLPKCVWWLHDPCFALTPYRVVHEDCVKSIVIIPRHFEKGTMSINFTFILMMPAPLTG